MVAPVFIETSQCLLATGDRVFASPPEVNKACCLADIGIYLSINEFRRRSAEGLQAAVGEFTDFRRLPLPV
jgi:hypothetical protein